MSEVLEQRIAAILQEESGTESLPTEATIEKLFNGNRKGIAAAVVRIEIASGLNFCDPCLAAERIKQMTVGAIIWGGKYLEIAASH